MGGDLVKGGDGGGEMKNSFFDSGAARCWSIRSSGVAVPKYTRTRSENMAVPSRAWRTVSASSEVGKEHTMRRNDFSGDHEERGECAAMICCRVWRLGAVNAIWGRFCVAC